MQPDGSYSLPLPPGHYLLFAEWFGNRRSQRQMVDFRFSYPLTDIDLPLLQGQEVSGTVRAGAEPLAGALVQAKSPDGKTQSTQTFLDGSYTLVLSPGSYQITTQDNTAAVTVADQPLDGVDFPPLPAAPPPGHGTTVTVAGDRMQGFGGDGGPAINARLPSPLGIAVNRAGDLYIVDSSVDRVRRVDAATGIITTVAGSSPWDAIHGFVPSITGGFSGDGGPATQALLNAPQHVAVDAAGNLYISEVLNQRIRKVDTSGIITTVVGTGQRGFSGDGGPATAAEITGPQGVAVDVAGNLYFCDTHNQRVRKVSTNGTITTIAGGGTDAVQLNNRIRKISPDGTIRTVAGSGPYGPGVLSSFAGDGGPATAARLWWPWGVAIDADGNLFFSDLGNLRVREVIGVAAPSVLPGR